MMDYTKYSDKVTLSKPIKDMDAVELDYFDHYVESNTKTVLEKYRDHPQLLNAVAMKLAEHVLKSTKKQVKDENDNGE